MLFTHTEMNKFIATFIVRLVHGCPKYEDCICLHLPGDAAVIPGVKSRKGEKEARLRRSSGRTLFS